MLSRAERSWWTGRQGSVTGVDGLECNGKGEGRVRVRVRVRVWVCRGRSAGEKHLRTQDLVRPVTWAAVKGDSDTAAVRKLGHHSWELDQSSELCERGANDVQLSGTRIRGPSSNGTASWCNGTES